MFKLYKKRGKLLLLSYSFSLFGNNSSHNDYRNSVEEISDETELHTGVFTDSFSTCERNEGIDQVSAMLQRQRNDRCVRHRENREQSE